MLKTQHISIFQNAFAAEHMVSSTYAYTKKFRAQQHLSSRNKPEKCRAFHPNISELILTKPESYEHPPFFFFFKKSKPCLKQHDKIPLSFKSLVAKLSADEQWIYKNYATPRKSKAITNFYHFVVKIVFVVLFSKLWSLSGHMRVRISGLKRTVILCAAWALTS